MYKVNRLQSTIIFIRLALSQALAGAATAGGQRDDGHGGANDHDHAPKHRQRQRRGLFLAEHAPRGKLEIARAWQDEGQ